MPIIFFYWQKSNVQSKDGKNIVVFSKAPSGAAGQIDMEEWRSEGIYKDWFGFKIGEERNKELKLLILLMKKNGA